MALLTADESLDILRKQEHRLRVRLMALLAPHVRLSDAKLSDGTFIAAVMDRYVHAKARDLADVLADNY